MSSTKFLKYVVLQFLYILFRYRLFMLILLWLENTKYIISSYTVRIYVSYIHASISCIPFLAPIFKFCCEKSWDYAGYYSETLSFQWSLNKPDMLCMCVSVEPGYETTLYVRNLGEKSEIGERARSTVHEILPEHWAEDAQGTIRSNCGSILY